MGGHGGLNILHQKKWNVYNLDNRMKVEKDRRQHREKKHKERTNRRNHETQERLELIREPEQKAPEQKSNLITEELRKINEGNKHINLFEHEQRMLDNREQTEAKILKEREYLKDKSFDMSSKFLGAYNDEKMKPWYLKTDNRTAPASKVRELPQQPALNHIKKSESEVTKEYLVTEQKISKGRGRSRSRSRDRQRTSSPSAEDKQSKLQRMRQQRREREEKERKRAMELLRQHRQ